MKLELHDTRSGTKRPFEPLDPERVTMYVCGPTVYNYVHIGNGRPAVVFDVLYRLLTCLYPQVVYARNFTDVDDKINAAAAQLGEPIEVITERYIDAYGEDVDALGVLRPDIEPRATHHIGEIIAFIERLIEREHAYAADGHVLFHVPSDPNYGALSHRSLDEMIDGARVEVAPYKRDPKDFVLWKPSTPEQPGWDSPWGRGRPGWHIECSAMIRKHLGPTIDIHGGGSDLAFPHHENELAQGTCLGDGAAFVRYWLHNGMLTLGSEKMSKSVGNVRTIRDLLGQYDGEVLRYALLSGHYRQQLAWGEDLIEQASASLDRLYQALRGTASEDRPEGRRLSAQAMPAQVLEPLLDDLNTPQALAGLHSIAGAMHRTDDPAEAARLGAELRAGAWLLGLLQRSPQDWFQAGVEMPAEDIERLIAERVAARQARNWARADAIRDELAAAGIELEDSREGTVWRRR